MREELLRVLAPVRPRAAQVPFCSTVTGALIDTSELDAGYWYTNLRQTVQLERATRTLVTGGHAVFVETQAGVGSGFADEDYSRAGATIVPSVARL